MPKLRSTYYGRLICQIFNEEREAFLGTIQLQNDKIVSDSACKSAYNIPKRIFSTS